MIATSIILLFVIVPSNGLPTVPQSEIQSLHDLFMSTVGENWKWKPLTSGFHWNFTTAYNESEGQYFVCDPCGDQIWQGLECESEGTIQHISSLILTGYNLVGPIPNSMSILSVLSQFDLSSNHINGTIPTCLMELTGLRDLSLGDNYLTGTIPPSIGNLIQLTQMALYGNYIQGQLPSSIGSLTGLISLECDYNTLNGSLPDSFHQLGKLQNILLNDNSFSGSLPSSIGKLTSLRYLLLSQNCLIGTIPESFSSLSALLDLNVRGNFMVGPIPDFVYTLTALQMLYLNSNRFTGSISSSIGNLTRLQFLKLDTNSLTGSLPTSIGLLSYMQYMGLYLNLLSGPIPDSIGALTEMYIFDVGINQFTSTLPASLISIPAMYYFNVSFNRITGTLPHALTTETQSDMGVFDVSHNHLHGELSKTLFVNMSSLYQVFFNYNEFHGPISNIFDTISVHRGLFNLDFTSNQFSGKLPSNELFHSTSPLLTFAASQNCLHGTLPNDLCSVKNLTALILNGIGTASNCQRTKKLSLWDYGVYWTSNKIAGTIPTCLYLLPNLETLHLSGNNIEDRFPTDVAEGGVFGGKLVDLSLSHNALHGPIPSAQDTNKDWKIFDISYNKVSGKLASSSFKSMTTKYSKWGKTTLKLLVNRLSGRLPSHVNGISHVNVLEGNLFACEYSENDLPDQDPKADTYECGSNSVNMSIFVWLALTGVLMALVGLLYHFFAPNYSPYANPLLISEFVKSVKLSFHGTQAVAYEEDKKYSDLYTSFTCQLAKADRFVLSNVVILSAGLCLVLTPTYVLLSRNYSVYDSTYAWTLSSAYLSGSTATFLCFSLWTVFLAYPIGCYYLSPSWFFYRHIGSDDVYSSNADKPDCMNRGNSTSEEIKSTFHCEEGSSDTVIDNIPHDNAPNPISNANLKSAVLPVFFTVIINALPPLIFALINCVFMLTANVCFVYIALTYGVGVVIMTQTALSVFKIVWNEAIIPLLIYGYKYTRACAWFRFISGTSGNDLKTMDSTASDISFHAVLIFINNIGMPVLATAFVSPNCFYNILVSPDAVESTYEYTACTHTTINVATGEFLCDQYANFIGADSFDPPFVYSYECSSVLLQHYSSVFVYVVLLASLLDITRNVLVADAIQMHAKQDPCLKCRTTENGLFPSAIWNIERALKATSTSLEDSKEAMLRLLTTGPLSTHRHVLRLTSYLSILLTFGVMFPPLAVLTSVAIVMSTHCNHAVLMYIAKICDKNSASEVSIYLLSSITRQLKLMPRMLLTPMKSICLCMSAFYSCFLFDLYGGGSGWKSACWLALVMLVMPVVCSLACKTIASVFRGKDLVTSNS